MGGVALALGLVGLTPGPGMTIVDYYFLKSLSLSLSLSPSLIYNIQNLVSKIFFLIGKRDYIKKQPMSAKSSLQNVLKLLILKQ